MCCRKYTDNNNNNKRTIRMKRKHDINNGMMANTPCRATTPSSSKTTITNLSTATPQPTTTELVAQSGQQCTRALQCDVPGTCDANLMTDMDLLGPCEPGTSVVLEGIVWTESNNGILVVNVTWRGKTYVGTLMDATRHHWAPPRYRDDSPVMDVDWKTPKYRNGRNSNASNNDSPMVEGRRLRKCRRNNNNNNNNNNNSTVSSLRSQARQSPVFNNDLNNSGGRRRPRPNADQQQQDEGSIPPKKSKDLKPDAEMLECNEGACGKKFKHATGLKYHQTHVHKKLPHVVVNGNVVEELKENLPSVAQESNKKSRKSSRNGSPEIKSESVSPDAEIVNAFATVPTKMDKKNLTEIEKLTPKSITPEPEACSSPSISEVSNVPEIVRSGKRKRADDAKTCDVKPDVSKLIAGSSVDLNSDHSSSTESRTDLTSSPVNHDEDCKPINFASAEISKSSISKSTTVIQVTPLNCKTSSNPSETVPESLVKTEPVASSTSPIKKEIKQEARESISESEKVQGAYSIKDSGWRDRMPPLISQPTPQAMAYQASMFGYGIDPIYHMQLMNTSPEYRAQFERWMTEQHYRHVYGRYDVERNSVPEAKPVDMTLKSSNQTSFASQDQSKKKMDPHSKRPVAPTSQMSVNNDKKIHSNKKIPPSTPPTTSQDDKKKFSSRPESRHQEPSPGQNLRGTPRSTHKETPDISLFQQGYPFAHPLAKLPFELQPNMHPSPFLDPAAAQVGLSRAPPHFSVIPPNSNKADMTKERVKTPTGKRSVDSSDDKETSSSKDKSLPLPSPLGGHHSPLTLRHLHHHHHTHVLGSAYSLYSSYNGMVPPVPQLVSPVMPVIAPSFIPK